MLQYAHPGASWGLLGRSTISSNIQNIPKASKNMHLLPTGYFCFCQLPYIASIYGLLGILVCVTPLLNKHLRLTGILVSVTPFIDQASTAYWVFHVFVKPVIDPASTASCVFYVYVNPVIDLASTAYWVFYVYVNPFMDQASTACWASARLYIRLFSNRLGVERSARKSSAAHWRV